jgi:hypothetical protein
MKFYVVERSDGKLHGAEYEEPYRYSEYTAGGGCWNTTFVPREAFAQDSDSIYKVDVFENQEVALEKANDWNGYSKDHFNGNHTYKAISIATLESRFK